MTMFVAAGVSIWQLRRHALATAEREMNNLGVVLAEQTSRTVQAVDLVLREVQIEAVGQRPTSPEQFRALTSGEDWHGFLTRHRENLPQAETIALVDAKGALLAWSRDQPVPRMDFSDREYFRYLRDHDDAGTYIAGPTKGLVTGTWLMLVIRRVNVPDGGFLGLVVGLIDIQYLENFYQTIGLKPGEAVTLLRHDGTVIASQPAIEGARGRRMVDRSPWFDRVANGGGSYLSPGYFDHIRRIITVHPLRDYPLVVDVNVSEQHALSAWRQNSIAIAGTAIIFALGITALFHVITRQIRELAAQNVDLQRFMQAFRESDARFRDFARTASDWFWEQDSDLRFTAIGEESPMPDRTDRSYIGETRWERNDTNLAPEAWAQHISDLTSHNPFSDFRYSLAGHDDAIHHISVSGVPVYDESGAFVGYRGTGRDITGQIEFERQLRTAKERAEQTEALLQDAIDSVPEGFVIYDKNERLIMCNETYHTRYPRNTGRMAAGMGYADIVKCGLAQRVYADAIGREEEWFAAWMEQHRNQPVAEELALTDGRWVLVTEGRMCNGGVSGLRIDITELKQAQAALRESEARLDRAQSIARIGSWELDVATGCYQWSKEMYRIRGLPMDEFEPSIRNLSQYIYPDDRPVARKWVAGLRSGNSPGRTEFRIVRPNGDVRWVSVDDGEQTDSVHGRTATRRGIAIDDRRSGATRSRHRQPRDQCERRHAEGRQADNRHVRRVSRCRLRRVVSRRRGRRLQTHRGDRYWHRDAAGRRGAHFRTVLHDQAFATFAVSEHVSTER